MELAFLLAGQGSQDVGMGSRLSKSCAECRSIFAEADRALDYSLTQIMFEGPADALRRTSVAQPAILTLSVAHARHLMAVGLQPDILAGHSLGQYSALVVAESLVFAEAIRLVAARGRLIQETVPEGQGAMAAVVGLEREDVYTSCAEARARGIVDVACHNSPGQTVISGSVAAVSAATELCEEAGGSVIPLAVSAPFHCGLLQPMVDEFSRLVEAVGVSEPRIPVIDNVTARPLSGADAVRRSLVAQLTAPVLFEETLTYLVAEGVRRFVQCGPGNALLSFARRIVRPAELDTFEAALERQGETDRGA